MCLTPGIGWPRAGQAVACTSCNRMCVPHVERFPEAEIARDKRITERRGSPYKLVVRCGGCRGVTTKDLPEMTPEAFTPMFRASLFNVYLADEVWPTADERVQSHLVRMFLGDRIRLTRSGGDWIGELLQPLPDWASACLREFLIPCKGGLKVQWPLSVVKTLIQMEAWAFETKDDPYEAFVTLRAARARSSDTAEEGVRHSKEQPAIQQPPGPIVDQAA